MLWTQILLPYHSWSSLSGKQINKKSQTQKTHLERRGRKRKKAEGLISEKGKKQAAF
jgi:hypothetical protein